MPDQKSGPLPLWLELLVLGGMVALATKLNSLIYPPPTGDEDLSHPHKEAHAIQQARARQPGRGRQAKTPVAIPPAGWLDIFWRVYHRTIDDRLLLVAAGVVFYLLLALFPAVTAFVSSYGLFADPLTISENLSALAAVMPEAGVGLVEEQVKRLNETSQGALSFGFLFGLAFAFWSANAGMLAVIEALNVAYGEREKRSYLELYSLSFALTIGAMLLLLAALSAVVVMPLVLGSLGLEASDLSATVAVLRWPALIVMALLWLAFLYRVAPSRRDAKWRWITIGSLFAVVAWMGVSGLYSWYLSHIANYAATYGSLGAAIGLMMWLWFSVIVMLIGAELNAEIEHQTACDTTVGEEKPLGTRGAVMADTVGRRWL
ncbi:MAG TPA: YihY/virulence factor BrkB family protein [Methyloceanibacter sp.]|jgi:membrane protein